MLEGPPGPPRALRRASGRRRGPEGTFRAQPRTSPPPIVPAVDSAATSAVSYPTTSRSARSFQRPRVPERCLPAAPSLALEKPADLHGHNLSMCGGSLDARVVATPQANEGGVSFGNEDAAVHG